MPDFETVKQYLLNLDLPVIEEDAPEELVVVRDDEAGISRLVIDCEARTRGWCRTSSARPTPATSTNGSCR